MKVAIMQPYFFPYIGYFQLVNAVDHFVFYDDVNFITRAWVNRNRILINNKEAYFTISCKMASQNKQINEIRIFNEAKAEKKLIRTIELAYKKAPFFHNVFPFLENLLENLSDRSLSDININTIKETCALLNISTTFHISSKNFPNKDMERADRLISITRELGGDIYINAINGQSLYSKEYFKAKDIDIKFLQPRGFTYQQFKEPFIPWLSIIDVLMFNPIEKIREALDNYELV